MNQLKSVLNSSDRNWCPNPGSGSIGPAHRAMLLRVRTSFDSHNSTAVKAGPTAVIDEEGSCTDCGNRCLWSCEGAKKNETKVKKDKKPTHSFSDQNHLKKFNRNKRYGLYTNPKSFKSSQSTACVEQIMKVIASTTEWGLHFNQSESEIIRCSQHQHSQVIELWPVKWCSTSERQSFSGYIS